jgi:hypothetical protein
VAKLDFARINPVTGPIFVDGARPGDALKVTIQEFLPSGFGWTANIRGFGLLADQFTEAALKLWSYERDAKTPAVFSFSARVPLKPFAGTIGMVGLHSVVPLRWVRRQSRYPRPGGGGPCSISRRGGGSAVLRRRYTCSPGRWRSLRHRHRKPNARGPYARRREGANLKTRRFTMPGRCRGISTPRATR